MGARISLPLLLLLTLAGASCGGGSSSATNSTTTPTSADWPMYGHDAGRTNYNRGETIIGLGAVPHLVPLFRTFIGVGDLPSSSGPVVAGGRVYVGSSVAEGNNYFCIDGSSGAPLWSADIGHQSFQGNVGIGSTAAVVDGVVYVGGGDSAYYALDALTGAILWRHPMNVAADDFAWSSPLVSGGVVYVGMSAQYKAVRSELRALDAASGALKARQFLVPEGTLGGDLWNSPALSPDGRSVLAASGNDLGFDGPNTRAMIAFDSSSLAILASHQEAVPNQDLDFGTTPVVFHDSSGRSLVGANQKNGKFYAYDLADISRGPVWERATGLGEGAMPAYDEDAGTGGTLFVVGDNGLLFGLDPASGADRWPPLAVGFSNGNVAAANGLVYTGGGAGNVSIVAADSGALLTVLAPLARDRTFSGVVVSGGTVYSVSGAYLNAWSATASGSPPPPNTSPRASVTLAIVPGPLTPGPDSRTPQTAHWRVVLTETAGVGGNVAFLNVSLRDLSSGARADPGSGLSLGEPEIVQRAGTNRIEPLGTLSLEESLSYTLRSGGQAVRLAAAIQFKDDNGHVVSATGEAQIQP